MANTIKLKRSSTANAVPTSGSLEYGELALNYTDGNLFFKTAGNAVTLIASTQTANYSGNVTAGNLVVNGISSLGNVGNVSITGGTNGYVLSTNGSGGLNWVAQSSGGTPGGSNTQVQFNDSNTFGGNANLTFNKATSILATKTIVFSDSAGNVSGFTAPGNITQPTTWKLPTTDGTVYGNVMATDTTGNLYWRGFTNIVTVYTRTGSVQVDAINGYLNILGRTGNILVGVM